VPVQEHRFHPVRKWRFDWAFPHVRLAVETEGAVWVSGRHTRGAGYIKDMEKYNMAQEMGWIVLRYQTGKIDYAQVKRVYENRLKHFA
jgi:very-short-patch-repair endonuclease